MTRTRLGVVSRAVEEQLDRMGLDRLRSLAPEVARRVVEHFQLDDPDVRAALESEPVPEGNDVRVNLSRVVERLDEIAWLLQDCVEAGTATQAEYEAAFKRARAAHALWFSLELDPLVAATEAAYEAYTATDDLSWIEDLVRD